MEVGNRDTEDVHICLTSRFKNLYAIYFGRTQKHCANLTEIKKNRAYIYVYIHHYNLKNHIKQNERFLTIRFSPHGKKIH